MISAKKARYQSILKCNKLMVGLSIVEDKIEQTVLNGGFSCKFDYIIDYQIQKYLTNYEYEVVVSCGDNTYTIVKW